MPMKTIGASMSGNSSVWSRASAAMPNTARAIVTTTVMIGRRIAKSEMNIDAGGRRDRFTRIREKPSQGWATHAPDLTLETSCPSLGLRNDANAETTDEAETGGSPPLRVELSGTVAPLLSIHDPKDFFRLRRRDRCGSHPRHPGYPFNPRSRRWDACDGV